jgi:undecaprenyl-diphosphatase
VPDVADLSFLKAIVLGLVEGVTEFLPISSTGHLVVVERLLGLGEGDAERQALDSYTVIIQAGAILAVLLVSWRRVVDVLRGLLGRSATGRALLVNLVLAVAPFGVVGALLQDAIKDRLLAPGPVAAAWIVGGVVILVLSPTFRAAHERGVGLQAISRRQALLIGLMQAFALWPGVSRSLVTIVGGLLIGLTMAAAVEFSFLLGLVTLGGATAVELVTNGSEVQQAYGLARPAVGVVVAAVSAFVAVRWMVAYLQRRSLAGFGAYRIGVGIVTLVLIATGVL